MMTRKVLLTGGLLLDYAQLLRQENRRREAVVVLLAGVEEDSELRQRREELAAEILVEEPGTFDDSVNLVADLWSRQPNANVLRVAKQAIGLRWDDPSLKC